MWYCCKCNGGGISGFSYMSNYCTACSHLRCNKCDLRVNNIRYPGPSKDLLNSKEKEERKEKANNQNQTAKEQREANKRTAEEEHKKFSLTKEAMTARRIKKEAEQWWQEEEGLLESIPGMVTRRKKREVAQRRAMGESLESILEGQGGSAESNFLCSGGWEFRMDMEKSGGQNGWGIGTWKGSSNADYDEQEHFVGSGRG
ncbi:MAG: hypothetical protein Q9214_002175 [Letrouitia sp. 1 TL-2023]